jgi:hypothetical protein
MGELAIPAVACGFFAGKRKWLCNEDDCSSLADLYEQD